MAETNKPVIVKRVKRVVGGHHGGAWKVAYADFVTAMMAFFLLMWLISSTTEDQRKGIAEYFNPNTALPSSTTGGSGPFGGSSLFSDDSLVGDTVRPPKGIDAGTAADGDEGFGDIAEALLGASGDAADADPMLRHVRTRITDEGLIIEIFDVEGSSLFIGTTDRPAPVLERLTGMIGRVLARTNNPVTGHLGAPLPPGDPWRLSAGRAQSVRQGLVEAGIGEMRIARVTGKADRDPFAEVPEDLRNRRVEITLLRKFPDGATR
jgi:chemotaxis protein MotB